MFRAIIFFGVAVSTFARATLDVLANAAASFPATIQQQLESLTRLLSNHVTRSLVFPDSEKDWLTETVIPRPLREFYLADHRRFNPMATLHFGSGQPLVPPAPTDCR